MDQNKAKLGAEGFSAFLNQFEKDKLSAIFLEILLEELMNAKNICVSGESKQEGHQISHGIEGQLNGDLPIDGSQNTETPTGLGESDSTNN